VPCKVKVRKSSLDYFRKLARKSPYEIEAYLIGEVVTPHLVIVEQFCYTKEYAEQTTSSVQWRLSELDRVRRLAEKKGKKIVGSIHSHPQWDAVLSEDDHIGQLKEGLRILGVCSVMGTKTRVRFWLNDSSLPCEIKYIGE